MTAERTGTIEKVKVGALYRTLAALLAGLLLLGFSAAWAQAGLVDNGDGTVSDTRTGLMWQQGDEQNASARTWEEALAYCEGLNLGGHDDWRLPNVRELASLVDDSRYHPAIDIRYFSHCHSVWYWSSSSGAGIPGVAWVVDFNYGDVDWSGKGYYVDVRCVRAGPTASVTVGESICNHNWTKVNISSLVANSGADVAQASPIVILGPATYNGSDPGVARLRNVTDTSFELRFQEWSYLDGWHTTEKYSYLVLEKGRRTMDDGSIWEAGTFVLDGTGKWSAVNFAEAFPGQPALFLTIQTFNESDPVTVRAKNVTTDGFEAALFEEEAKMDGHVTETVGYLAVYNPQGWGTVSANGTQTPYLLQKVTAGNVFTPVLSYSLKVEEEKSKDSEVNHIDENLSVMVLGDKLFAQDVSTNGGDPCALRLIRPEYGAALEWGTVDGVNQNWLRVPLAKHFTHPVLVAKPVSYRGADPGVIRIRNVDGDRFDVKFQEWLCKDGWHTTERVFYLVAEEGVQDFGDDWLVQAGSVSTSKLLKNGWEKVDFSTPFNQQFGAVIFTSVDTYAGSDPVITRVRNATQDGFDLTMDEEEAKRDGHVTETIGWIAVTGNCFTLEDGHKFCVNGPYWVDSHPTRIDEMMKVDRRFPVLVAAMQTTNGGDPCVLRYQNLSPSAVDLFLQEEPSLDGEMDHIMEEVGIFVGN